MNYLRYVLVFTLTAMGTGVLLMYLQDKTQSPLGSSAQVLVPAMIAALIEGQRFARHHGRKPTYKEAMNFMWIASGIAMALNLAFSFLAASLLPEFAKLAIAPVFSAQFNVLMLIFAVGYLISNRFFLGIGAGNEITLSKRPDE
jgi:hypothetical protein